MSVYVCILMLWPCVHSADGLPYCTLGSQPAGDGVSWVGIWKSWPLVQADCGQPWVQLGHICSIGRRQGQPLYRPHSKDPGQRPPPDACFCSHSALRHFEINLAVIWFKMVHFTKRPCCSEVVLKAF